MWLQAVFWHKQYRFEDARFEALRAVDIFEKLGAADAVEGVSELLQQIGREAQRSDLLFWTPLTQIAY